MLLLPAFVGVPEVNRVYHVEVLTLLKAMGDASVDLICVDPPYGVGKPSAWRPADERFSEIVGNAGVNTGWISEAFRVLKDTAAMYLFANWQTLGQWQTALTDNGFAVRSCIVWDKLQHGMADIETCFAPQHELILFAAKGRHLLRGKRHPDIIRYPKVQPTNLVHPYEKPVGLLEFLIEKSTDKGALVVDCFAGSGATGQAARNTGRDYILADLEAEFVALARSRVAMPYTPLMFAA